MGGLASGVADFNRGIFGTSFNPSDPADLHGTTAKYNQEQAAKEQERLNTILDNPEKEDQRAQAVVQI